jgi:nicotinate-nucleotide pyrophosphorylase (carboxylating)
MSRSDLGNVDEIVQRALEEDIAAGDVTSRAVVGSELRASARIVAKQDLVVCGGPAARRAFELVDPDTTFEIVCEEGTSVSGGTVLARLAGRARSLLAAERTALNLMQHMAGVATLTRAYVEAAGGRCRITDTRKTTPGLRALDRYAVRCGGGKNHRNDLGAGVLIKENHIRCAGGVKESVRAARASVPHVLRVECEVQDLSELRAALDAGAEAVLLDNMDDATIEKAVEITGGRALLEVSGGVTLERVPRLAALGVDLVSVGALTHSAPAVDISLLFEAEVGETSRGS